MWACQLPKRHNLWRGHVENSETETLGSPPQFTQMVTCDRPGVRRRAIVSSPKDKLKQIIVIPSRIEAFGFNSVLQGLVQLE
jgi:hypothetical protein